MLNLIQKRCFLFTVFIASFSLFSCNETEIDKFSNTDSIKTKSTQEFTALSMARIHNDLMCKRFIAEGDYYQDIDNIEFLSRYVGSEILGYDFNPNIDEILNSQAYEISKDISYNKVVSHINNHLSFLQEENEITPEFRNLIQEIYVPENNLGDINILNIISKLNDYKSKNVKEEILLQKFTLQLIYSGALWEIYFKDDIEQDISYISRGSYIGLCDAGGSIVGTVVGGGIGSALGCWLLSEAARSDIEHARICLCWGGYEKECPIHGKKPNTVNVLENIVDGEFRLSHAYEEELRAFIQNHPLIPLDYEN